MPAFLATCTTAPTVVFTVLLGLAGVYWLLVALGAFDVDLFHLHLHFDASGHGLHPHGLFEFLSLGQVPVTLIATFYVTFAWFLCLAGEVIVRPALGPLLPGSGYAALSGLAAAVVALPLTGLAARPLRGVFTLREAASKRSLIGRQVTVTSVTADERFGTGTVDLAGDDILLHLVTRPGVVLAKGESGVVVDFDEARDVYLVAPLPHLRPGFVEAPGDRREPT